MSCLWLWWCRRRRVQNIDSDSSSGGEDGGERERKSEKGKKKRRWRKWLKLPWEKSRKGHHEEETALYLEEKIPNPVELLSNEEEEKREQLLEGIHLVTCEDETSDEVTDHWAPTDLKESELPELHPLDNETPMLMSDEAEDDVTDQLMHLNIDEETDDDQQQIIAGLVFDLVNDVERVINQHSEGIQQVTEEVETSDEELIDQWVPIDLEESELPELHPLGDNDDMMETDDADLMAALSIRAVLNSCTEDKEMDIEENPQEDFDIFKQVMSDILDEVEYSTVQANGDDLHNTIDEKDSDADASGQLLSLHLDRTGMDSDQSLESQTEMTKKITTAATMKAVVDIFMKDNDGHYEIDREEDNKEDIRINEDEVIEVPNEEYTEEDNKDKMDLIGVTEVDIEDDKKENMEDTEKVKQEDTEAEPENDSVKVCEQDSVGTPLGGEKQVEKDIIPVRKTKRRRRRGTRGKGRRIKYKKDQNGLTGGRDVGSEASSNQMK